MTFVYNAAGQRMQKQTNSATQRYVYDFDKVLQEADGSNTTTEEFTATLEPYGDLISAYGNGQNLYYEYDALGSADALLDANASVTNRYAYRAFGQVASQSGPGSTLPNPYTWVGQQGYYDDPETGLYFLRARYYDPAAARFLSEDPLGYRAGTNLYQYAFNNPINHIDPSGMWPPFLDRVGAAIARPFVAGARLVRRVAGYAYDGAVFLVDKAKQLAAGFTANLSNVFNIVVDGLWGGFTYVTAKIGQLVTWGVKLFTSCLFNQALQWAGIPNPQELWNKIQYRLGFLNGAQLQKLVRNVKSILLNLLKGAALGFDRFGRKLFDNFLGALGTWLNVPERVFRLLGSLNLSNLPELLLTLLGYTWDNVLGLLQGALGSKNYAILARVVSALVEAFTQGVPQFIQAQVAKIQQQAADLWDNIKSSFTSIVEGFFVEISKSVVQKVALALVEKLISLLSPTGWLWTLVKTAYQAVTWLINNYQRILGLIKSFYNAFQAAVSGQGSETIAGYVEGLLKSAIVPVLDAIARVFNLGNLPGDVRKILGKIQMTALAPLKWVIEALGRLAKKVLGGLLKTLHLEGLLPLVDPSGAGKGGRRLWVSGRAKLRCQVKGKNVDVDVAQQLQKYGKSTAAKTALATAKRLNNKATSVENSLSPKQNMSKASNAAKQLQQVKPLQMQLEMQLNDVSTCELCAAGSCFVAGVPVYAVGGVRRIETLAVGDWVRGEEGLPHRVGDIEESSSWRVVRLWLRTSGGDEVEAELLRRADWVLDQGAETGSWLWLDLPHVGVRGEALVTSVSACASPVAVGSGLVTGRFKHVRGWAWDVVVEGESRPIGVTAAHPMWSADRRDWVAAAELRVGERLQALDGRTPCVLGLTLRAGAEPVYNIEVEGDHCYRVGEQGLLVHNASDDYERYASAAEVKVFDIANEKFTILTNEGIKFGPKGSVNRNTLGRTAEIRDEKYGFRFDVVIPHAVVERLRCLGVKEAPGHPGSLDIKTTEQLDALNEGKGPVVITNVVTGKIVRGRRTDL